MNIEETIESISNNLINGNRNDALYTFYGLPSLQAGYIAVMINENETIGDVNKRWLLNALRNGTNIVPTLAFAYSVNNKSHLSNTYTERGTKKKCSLAGGKSIGKINTKNNMYIETHRKENGRWVEV